MKSTIRLHQLKDIIESYKYPLPLKDHLKEHFRKNKNAGSRDRKELRHLSNSYLRLGKYLSELPFEERANIADFLFGSTPILENTFGEDYSIPIESKLEILGQKYPGFDISRIFPYPEMVSDNIDKNGLFQSYLKQGYVWIKVSPGNEGQVENELLKNNIPFEKQEALIWKFNPDAKLTETQSFIKGYFRIQDYSTQSVSAYYHAKPGEKWWDCCAGSGGKSISLLESYRNIDLYASDIRPSILSNLEERFQKYHIHPVRIFKADLEKETPGKLPMMDGIIADVPCSGSGTWARTPEHLRYFEKEKIYEYSKRQLSILENVFPLLKPGKPLLYITCSVYKEENENVVEAFCAKHSVKIEEQKYLEGFHYGAENIFLCRMIKMTEE